ncbi:MAG: S8 family peptidase [Chloroflexi bacterium]|nr:S8 family peptidase [Chloroflexota bacterium]
MLSEAFSRSNAVRLRVVSALPVHGRPMPLPAQLATAPATAPATDQIIVKLRTEGVERMSAAEQRLQVESVAARVDPALIYKADHGNGVHTLRLGGPGSGRLGVANVQAVAAQLAADPRVLYAEPDWIMWPTLTPNDSLYAAQWNYMAVTSANYGVNLPAAWDVITGSSSIVVAVIDTGYRPHVDLANRFVQGYDFIDLEFDELNYFAASANDGDGRDADARDPGDWITSAESVSGWFRGCPQSNSSWHGTHVAGTIGAVSNNGSGVTGINWVSKILPVRVLGKCGGYTSNIVDGMRWAAGLPVAGVPVNANPAQVLNISLGGSCSLSGPCCPDVYQSAIDDIVAAGAVVVVAAGNSHRLVSTAVPAVCDGVITVAATGQRGNRSLYSNYGPQVEIAAPGGDNEVDSQILSTLNAGTTVPAADSYAKYQGTSMAAPHVAGIASLVLSVNPCLTPRQVNEILRSTVTAFPAGSTCTTASCGAGIVNAGAAVAAARTLRAQRGAARDVQPLGQAGLLRSLLSHNILIPTAYRNFRGC